MPSNAYETFEIYLDDDRYAVPTLHLIDAPDELAAVEIAKRLLSESDHHRGAELCREGERLMGLGTFANRRVAAEARVGDPAE